MRDDKSSNDLYKQELLKQAEEQKARRLKEKQDWNDYYKENEGVFIDQRRQANQQ